MTRDVLGEIADTVNRNRVVLYMKGTPQSPMCGFSARAAALLQQIGVDFVAIDVLKDPEIREGIKTYGRWPTIPQLYVNGDLVGGSDIMSEMAQSGELQKLLASTK
jgi:monothiol glutaredoxin